MPTKKESHAKRASISLTPRFHRRGTPSCPTPPIMQNEPNKLNARRRRASTYITPRFHRRGTPSCPTPPKKTKRTQFSVPLASRRLPHPPLCKTNPISVPAAPPLCETNPIPQGQQPKANSQKKRNEPNYRRAGQTMEHPPWLWRGMSTYS